MQKQLAALDSNKLALTLPVTWGWPPDRSEPGYVPECHVDLGWEGGRLSKGSKNLEKLESSLGLWQGMSLTVTMITSQWPPVTQIPSPLTALAYLVFKLRSNMKLQSLTLGPSLPLPGHVALLCFPRPVSAAEPCV